MVWESLVAEDRPWLDLTEVDIVPRVLESSRPGWVLWSSLWPARRLDQVAFAIEPDGGGCSVRWSLLAPDDDQPEPNVVKRMRYRLNYLINGQMRATFDL